MSVPTMEIPALVKDKISPKALDTLQKVRRFVETECIPADAVFEEQLNSAPGGRFSRVPPIMEELKTKARDQGLWNLFLPKRYSETAGFTNLEYALMAEHMGRCLTASEAMNCGAPDTGNMELLAYFGTPEQKKQWLEPLMDGRIRSAFCMTEKGVPSSDATNIRLDVRTDGDEFVLNGTKWWASGAGDPRCELLLVMGKTGGTDWRLAQHTVFIVPRNTPGVHIVRPMRVFGYDDAPHGHMEIRFENVRVPSRDVIAGVGRGFEVVQGRLGPGRIHHCMRMLGVAEQALHELVARVSHPSRHVFGRALKDHGTIRQWIVGSRIEIDAARMLVLAAAHKIDIADAHGALEDISKAKIFCPNVCLKVLDRAIQAFGAEGVSQDTNLARAYALNRTMRIADGPDEVHIHQLSRRILKRYQSDSKL